MNSFRFWTILFFIFIFLPGCAANPPTEPTLTQAITPSSPVAALPEEPGRTLTGPTGPVTRLVWNPDGTRFATCSGDFSTTDFTIRLWSADGTPLSALEGHTAPIMDLAWSPDGQTLASASLDRSIRLWSREGQPLNSWHGEAGAVFALAWSPDGETLASGSIEQVLNPTVQLWDRQGWIRKTLSTKFSGGKFYNLAWSPEGKYLVGGATDYKLWSAAGEEIFWLEHSAGSTPSWGMAWSPDSSKWAVGDESGYIDVISSTGANVASLHDESGINALAWSPDSQLLAGAKTLWRADGSKVARLDGQPEYVNSAAWSPDGRLLAAGGSDGKARFFDRAGRPRGELTGDGTLLQLAWSPDGTRLAAGFEDGTIHLWNLP